MFSKFCSILILSCSLRLWRGGGGGGFLMIIVSHPTFCCVVVGVVVGVVVEVSLGCDNNKQKTRYIPGCLRNFNDFMNFTSNIVF